jgi:NDP-sugar pyrophosphorylase family protein
MIYVVAGGQGSRIREGIERAGLGDTPKHLLPVTEQPGDTLVRRSALSAITTGHSVQIITNPDNHNGIDDNTADLDCITDKNLSTSSLGPFCFTESMGIGETSFGVSGDVYIEDLDWVRFVERQEYGGRPVTFLVKKEESREAGAVFEIDEPTQNITNFHRTDKVGLSVYRNIGVYGFTMTREIKRLVDTHSRFARQSYDEFAVGLIACGLVQAQLHDGHFVNINTLDDYNELLTHTGAKVSQRTD